MRLSALALAVAILVPATSLRATSRGEVPGARLPVLAERHYEMSGAVRPLLFWISRDGIGLARIVWRKDASGSRGYELLVGTDPARAPRALNRWGYIAEETSGNDGSLLALMTGSHETSYDDEAVTAGRGDAKGDFRAILARVESGTAHWRLARVLTPEALTVHDVGRAVASIGDHAPDTAARQRPVASRVRPGFLIAVADLLGEVVAFPALRKSANDAARVQYVFGEQTYEIHVRRLESQTRVVGGVRTPAVKASFETRTLSTGARSQFTIVAGTSGELTGVPLDIEWQPRWWLKVRLALRD